MTKARRTTYIALAALAGALAATALAYLACGFILGDFATGGWTVEQRMGLVVAAFTLSSPAALGAATAVDAALPDPRERSAHKRAGV